MSMKYIFNLCLLPCTCKICQICTHTIHTLSNLFGDVNSCGLREGGRVRMNHMITSESTEIIFFTYIIPLYIYLGRSIEKTFLFSERTKQTFNELCI